MKQIANMQTATQNTHCALLYTLNMHRTITQDCTAPVTKKTTTLGLRKEGFFLA